MSRSNIHSYANGKGLKIVEATESLPITVTARDAKVGARMDPKNCAFAKACKRQNDLVAAYFFPTFTYLETKNKELIRYKNPPSVQREVISFDRGGTLAPGDYMLSPISPSCRLDAIRKRAKKHRNTEHAKTGRKRSAPHETTGIRKSEFPL